MSKKITEVTLRITQDGTDNSRPHEWDWPTVLDMDQVVEHVSLVHHRVIGESSDKKFIVVVPKLVLSVKEVYAANADEALANTDTARLIDEEEHELLEKMVLKE